jgi:hypothetical protein
VLAFLRRGAFVPLGLASDGVASTVRGRFHFPWAWWLAHVWAHGSQSDLCTPMQAPQVQVSTVPQGFLGGFPEAIKRLKSDIPSASK